MTSSSSLGDVFSFDTPAGVLRVLASIRQSEISADQKNELRDLVLSYTNGGKDPSLQIEISQKLRSLGVTLAAAPAQQAPAIPPIVHDFGSARNVPTFAPSKAAQASTAPTPKPAPAAQSIAEPAPRATPKDQPAPVTPIDPVPPAADVQSAEATPVAPPEQYPATAIPSAATSEMQTPAASSTATPSADPALTRIREIKSLVNQKVGNPVNLVDIDNVVGREYMSALLDAMKQLNSGINTDPAMARLETAYQAVETLLSTRSVSGAVPPSPPTPVPSAAPAPVAPQTPIVPPAPQPAPVAATPAPAETPAPAAPADAQPVSSHQADTKNASTDNRWGQPEPEPVAAPVSVPIPTPPAPVSASIPAVPQPPKAAPATPQSPVIKPISESAPPLKTIADVPTAASINSSETGDPLYTNEVTNGLNQLLSDWMLFKKSGLFGTGPNGIEHPLYIKIKDLQIPLLLAGRFEGATQEIKQSVTDYMNGWRYEQGIIYEQGEVFDHYLRRVIRHILDLQK